MPRPASLEGGPSPTDKGKQRADPILDATPTAADGRSYLVEIPNAIEEALATPLPPPTASVSLRSPFERPSPIPLPPKAHHPSFTQPPRLLSQLTRSTLPTAGLSYASSDHAGPSRRAVSHAGLPQLGESSTVWQRGFAGSTYDDSFPDLDPETGLPVDLQQRRGSVDSEVPSLHLQRTITDLLASPPKSSGDLASYIPKIQLPSLGLPTRLSTDANSRRSFSSSADAQEWYWPSGWWGRNKVKVDRLVAEEDQADTVEEEKEGIQRKCECRRYLIFARKMLRSGRSDPEESSCLLSWFIRL